LNVGAVIQLFKITKQIDISASDVNGLWDIFKIQNLTGNKFYKDKEAVYSHFINWSKMQNIEKNGTTGNNSCVKSGTSKDRVEALKKW
jgi:hypothetical protein